MARSKLSLSAMIFDTLNVLFMCFLMLITIYPLIYIVLASVSDPIEMTFYQGALIKPLGFTIDAYKGVLQNPAITRGYANTLFLLVVGVSFSLLVTSLGAYVLSRKNVLLKNFFMFLIVFTMFFHGGLIPFYMVVKGVGLYNSLWACIIPFTVNAFNLILMRTAFESIPDSLEESAKIDGANHFVILFRIILPLSLPVIAVMLLYYAVEKWNGWFYASIFLQDKKKYPLQVVLREILLNNDTEGMTISKDVLTKSMRGTTTKYAAIVFATLPMMLIYPFVQKYFVKGVMVGAVKG